MKIDTTTIEGYESMTAEEKLAALEGFEYDDGADEIARLKAANTKASKEAAEWKHKHNALLDDDEKKQQEAAEKQQQMEQELETLRREKKESAYKAKLLSDGYDDELAQSSAEALASGDLDTFFKNQKKFIEIHDKEYKKKLMNQDLKPEGGNSKQYKTKDEIMKIKDPQERQAAIASNPELFGYQKE